jgi:hypothetical protein
VLQLRLLLSLSLLPHQSVKGFTRALHPVLLSGKLLYSLNDSSYTPFHLHSFSPRVSKASLSSVSHRSSPWPHPLSSVTSYHHAAWSRTYSSRHLTSILEYNNLHSKIDTARERHLYLIAIISPGEYFHQSIAT